jgi:DNA-binding transcriptional LysR family regulator
MDLRHVRAVLAVAEELNFRRAAERCRIAQPALSRTVAELEHEVGTLLFDRSRNHVELTPAGAAFVRGARRILREVDATLSATRAGGLTEGTLRLSMMIPEYTKRPPIATALRALRRVHPRSKVEIEEIFANKLARALHGNVVDVGFAFAPIDGDTHGLQVDIVLQDEIVAAVAHSSPLSALKLIELRELVKQPVILFPRACAPDRYDDLVGHFQRAGLRPRVVAGPPTLRATLDAVERGEGVSIVPSLASETEAVPGVRLRPIAGLAAYWTFVMVRRSDLDKPLASEFIAAVRRAVHHAQ